MTKPRRRAGFNDQTPPESGVSHDTPLASGVLIRSSVRYMLVAAARTVREYGMQVAEPLPR